jgi:hypothetical protein
VRVSKSLAPARWLDFESMERSELRAKEEVPEVKGMIIPTKWRTVAISCMPDHDIGVESMNTVMYTVKKEIGRLKKVSDKESSKTIEIDWKKTSLKENMNRLDLGQSRLFEDEEKKYEMKQVGNKANIGSECAFCEIARDQRRSHVVFQDALSIGFLDRRPVFFGHCLLVPRNHYQTLYDLPDELLFPIFRNTQRLGKAIEATLNAERTFIGINNKARVFPTHTFTWFPESQVMDCGASFDQEESMIANNRCLKSPQASEKL